MKDPKKMTTEEFIELADEIKKGMTTKFLKDIAKIRASKRVKKMKAKRKISKKEAIMIADRVKSGMSIKVMRDLEELKHARSKVLMVKQS